MTEPADLATVAVKAVDVAHNLLSSLRPGQLTQKTERDFASELDFTIERAVRAYLQGATPDIGFLGEEEGAVSIEPGEAFWALDPVDGTANLVHGLPLCGISLGLIQEGRPTLGVIDLPFLGERYTAREGNGARLNGNPIHASQTTSLTGAVVSLGDFAVGPKADQRNQRRHLIVQHLAAEVERIRMLGSAAIDLAWVAAGRLDASVMLANKPWDVAAGVIIAREAGAHVLDLDGSTHSPDSLATISTTPGVESELVELLSRTGANTAIQ